MNLDDLTVLNDIRERLAKITPEQIEATNRKLDKVSIKRSKSEKVVGTVEPETTRALYALIYLLDAEEMTHTAMAHAEVDEIREQDHKRQAAFLDMLSDVVKEMFWAQAKIDCGFHEKASVGLRHGWQLVKDTRPSGPAGFITQMMGGIPGISPPDDEE